MKARYHIPKPTLREYHRDAYPLALAAVKAGEFGKVRPCDYAHDADVVANTVAHELFQTGRSLMVKGLDSADIPAHPTSALIRRHISTNAIADLADAKAPSNRKAA